MKTNCPTCGSEVIQTTNKGTNYFIPVNDGWISVEDRLPESGKYIEFLIFTEYGVSVSYWKGSFWDCEYPVKNSIVTHWQPLPSPPKQ